MPMLNKNQTNHWSYHVYLHILDKHAIRLEEKERELNQHLFWTLNYKKTMTLDGYLYSLNLFRRAIMIRDQLTIDSRKISVPELIYVCILLGHKFSAEPIAPWNSDLCDMLSPDHPYYKKIKETQRLEQQFLKLIDWRIEFDPDTVEEALLALIQPLSQSSRRYFMSEILTLKITSAGDFTHINKLLKKHFPEFKSIERRALTLHSFIKNMPLINHVIDSSPIWMFIRNNIYLLMNEQTSTIPILALVKIVITDEIERHFTYRKQDISDREEKLLSHYFKNEGIFLIHHNNRVIRLTRLYNIALSNNGDEEISCIYYETLHKVEKQSRKMPPSSLLTILGQLENLDEENEFDHLVFSTVFLKLNLSVTIAEAYTFLHKRGMLSVINTNRVFARYISNLLLTNANLLTEAKLYQCLEDEFNKHYQYYPLTFNQLTSLKKKLPSDLLAKLIAFSLEDALSLFKLAFTHEDGLEGTLLTLRDHLKSHPSDGMKMLYAIEKLKTFLGSLTLPLLQCVFQEWEHMQYVALVITTLSRDLSAHSVFMISHNHPELYLSVGRAIQQTPEAQQALKQYFDFGKEKIPPYQTSSIISELVKNTVIAYVVNNNILAFNGDALTELLTLKKKENIAPSLPQPFYTLQPPAFFSQPITKDSPQTIQASKSP